MTTNMTNGDDNRWPYLYLLFAILITIFIVVTFSSCKTTHVPTTPPPVETHNEQTTNTNQEQTNTTVIHEKEVKDSTIIIYKDSIQRIEHWHYERDYTYEKYLRSIIDSLLKLKQDSIPYPVYVDKEVPARMTNWQIFLITLGKVFIVILGLALAIAFLKRRFL